MRNRDLIGMDVQPVKDPNSLTLRMTLYTTNIDFTVKFFKE